MSIIYSVDLQCDVCANWVGTRTTQVPARIPGHVKKLRAEFKGDGWERRRWGTALIDVCGACAHTDWPARLRAES